ncbi:hypothetical protein ACFUEJ_11420 [Gordonia sp. NPDC057258]|uniref:hypothetical protein n=1 Tax=unclassified Gordonia (in: high G+C Gram-positive bacteria) TaxID=2657482 RepID=UPI00363AF9BD
MAAGLGGTAADVALVRELTEIRVLVEVADRGQPQVNRRRFVLTRSGLEVSGIDAVARPLYRLVRPVLRSWLGRVALAAVVVGGVVSLCFGRPAGPQVSDHSWVDALLGMTIALGCSALHELGHAVTLVHYGRKSLRAGCGFYWGALCFYVDSSQALTLTRRARMVNALAGLGVDVVTTSVLLMISQVSTVVLIYAVCWRVAILSMVDMVENALPILEVDGQIALSDALDEPDLSRRSREALGRRLRRTRRSETPRWLPWFGLFSLTGGIALLAISTYVWWYAIQDLIAALFAGNGLEIVLGVYLILPFLVGTLFSVLGLIIETFGQPPDSSV